MSDTTSQYIRGVDLLAKRGLYFDSDIPEKTYSNHELNIMREARFGNIEIDLPKKITSFSERFNNYLKANEQGGIANDVQIKPLINPKVMDTESYGFTQGFTVTVKSQKSKFNPGDKVKIIKDHIMDIKRETINFKGFEGVVYSSLNLISGMYNQNVLNCSYDVDINGFIVVCQESDLELIEQLKKMEYRADLYDLSDDIDGVLLPDSKPNIDFIQRFDK